MTYVDALQTTLAAEHAAVYVYAYLGGQASSSREPDLATALGAAYAAHLARRDDVTARLVAAGAAPTASAAAYDLPDDRTPRQLAAAALGLEQACAATYLALVASTPTSDRAWAVGLLTDAALRSLTFGGRPETYPGR